MINIRKVSTKDLDAISNLYMQLNEAESPFDNNLDKNYYHTEENKQRILKEIRSRKQTFLVAEENHQVIGCINGYIDDGPYYIEKVAYLNNLCVDKNFRKQGIGKLLINAFYEKMKEQGAKFVKLNAFKGNHPAVSFYEKEGFTEYSVYYQKKL